MSSVIGGLPNRVVSGNPTLPGEPLMNDCESTRLRARFASGYARSSYITSWDTTIGGTDNIGGPIKRPRPVQPSGAVGLRRRNPNPPLFRRSTKPTLCYTRRHES